MAELHSEDVECSSKLQLIPGEKKILSGERTEGQQWQVVKFLLISGARRIETATNDEVMLCRDPSDEVTDLVQRLEHLLERKREQVYFEPSEPSFELSLIRTRRGGIKAEAWIDAGNGSTGIYTWDAAGIRFYCTDANIRSFINELKAEFGL